MDRIVWLAIAAVGGTAAILGSLMVLGSVLLWLVPDRRSPSDGQTNLAWTGKLLVLAVSLALSLIGIGLLAIVPFPDSAA